MNGETINEIIFDFVFNMAFNDATMRAAFVNPYKEDEKDKEKADKKFKQLKEKIKDKAMKPVRSYLNGIIGKGNIPEPLVFINKVLENVHNENEKDKDYKANVKDFTFGNAQKLVNMAAKYLFIACYADESLKKRFEKCHCPMDSIMIKAVLAGLDIKERKKHKLKMSTSWSTKDCNLEKYNDFQALVKDACKAEDCQVGSVLSPIEYDYLHWEAFAKEYGS